MATPGDAPDGQLSCLSVEPAAQADLLAGAVPFRDYIIEGFLTYTVQAELGARLHASSYRRRIESRLVHSSPGAALHQSCRAYHQERGCRRTIAARDCARQTS